MNFKEFDNLIHSGSKEIVLDSDVILDDEECQEYSDGIMLDVDDLTIDGNGHAIDAKGKTRIFYCTAKDVTIMNVDFKHGSANDYGGAIYARHGKMDIVHSKFIENTAKVGGAIINMGEMTLTKTIFYLNESEQASAIRNIEDATLSISDSTFYGNLSGSIGAIVNSGMLSISDSRLNNNENLLITNHASLTIENSKFHKNADGGIINEGELAICESSFKDNDDAGIYNNDGATLTIFKSTFCANEKVSIMNEGKMSISHSIFKGNVNGKISNVPPLLPKSSVVCKLSISHSRFEENRIAGIYNNKGEMSISSCTINENRDGIISNEYGGTLTVYDSKLFENVSVDKEELIANAEGSLKISGCEISNNSAANIIDNSDYMQVYNSDFKYNHALNMIANSSNMGIFSGKFIANGAESVIFNSGKDCFIDRCRFENMAIAESMVNINAMTLNNPIMDDECEMIFNEGCIFISDPSQDLLDKIHGSGKIVTRKPVQRHEFDFSHLDGLIHGSDSLEIVLEEDILFGDYETDYYEGGIELDIDGLVIDGKGHAIDGADKSRIFLITAKGITLKNIIFKNGKSHKSYDNRVNNSGGAIKNNFGADLKIENCRFQSNVSEEHGGAIHNNGNISMVKSLFDENMVATRNSGGGALLNTGMMAIEESVFVQNNAKRSGGAIYNRKGRLRICESCFILNLSFAEGAAIFNDAELEISGSAFVENTSMDRGGAISGDEQSDMTISNSMFFKNNSKAYGGAITLWKGKLTISESEFIQNTAKRDGGVICNSFAMISISKSSFDENEAFCGGVVYGEGALSISDSTFTKNSSYTDGGVLYCGERCMLSVSNSEFSENTAEHDGGVIFTIFERFDMDGCKFTANVPDDVYVP